VKDKNELIALRELLAELSYGLINPDFKLPYIALPEKDQFIYLNIADKYIEIFNLMGGSQ